MRRYAPRTTADADPRAIEHTDPVARPDGEVV
jgi:hypothetical protein